MNDVQPIEEAIAEHSSATLNPEVAAQGRRGDAAAIGLTAG
jgi:hypothetical protein